MKKKCFPTERKRVLARVLAEELCLVQGGGCGCGGTGATIEITGGGGDVTNIGGDGDGPEKF